MGVADIPRLIQVDLLFIRLSESPDRLGSVFNAEYNVSPAKQNTVANVKQELSPPASEPVSPILGGPEVVASAGEPR